MQNNQKWTSKMDVTLIILGVIALFLLIIAFFQQADLALEGIKNGGLLLWRNLPILLLSFIISGMVQVLIPQDIITQWLGDQTGIRGVLIGCIVGGLVPGAPYAVFPLVAVLYKAGAGLGAVVGFVSAWSLWSVSRLPVEMALIDPQAALIRYAITFLVPPLAGLVAQFIAKLI